MINSINAIGASATPIPFSELFQALKTGVVDGAENSAKIFMSYKYDEAGCNCFTLTEHFATQHALVANRSWLDNLEPKYKKRILEVAEEIVPAFDKIWNDAIAGALQAMQEKGITVNRISNKKAFVDRVESVSEQFFESYPVVPRTFYDRIRNIAMEFE